MDDQKLRYTHLTESDSEPDLGTMHDLILAARKYYIDPEERERIVKHLAFRDFQTVMDNLRCCITDHAGEVVHHRRNLIEDPETWGFLEAALDLYSRVALLAVKPAKLSPEQREDMYALLRDMPDIELIV